MNDSITQGLRQLREDLGNAQECEDETVEVPVDALDTVLAAYDRLTIEVEQLRGDLLNRTKATAATIDAEPPVGTVVRVGGTRWKRIDEPGFMTHRQWVRIHPAGYEDQPETWQFLAGHGDLVRIVTDAPATKEA